MEYDVSGKDFPSLESSVRRHMEKHGGGGDAEQFNSIKTLGERESYD